MKITILSDSPFIPTGYSDQSKQLADFLTRRGHEVHFLANAYQGSTIQKSQLTDGTEFNYKIYGMGKQPYFADVMSQHLKETNSDKFFILLDTFMLFDGQGRLPHGWFLNIDCSPAQTYFWFPSDGGGGMPVMCDAILKKVEHPVAMSQFGQKQVKDYYNLDVHHIPHGTNTKRFYKLPDEQRNEAKRKWEVADKFVIGVVARNQPRKMLDRTIKTMHYLKDKIPNAVLFLHLDPNDAAQIFNIRSLIAKYNLENRVVYTNMSALKGFAWNQMNEIYNVMDCFLLTTSGEGFGIPIIEAMACEVPVVATDYTTTTELVVKNNAGLGIRLASIEKMDLFEHDSKKYDLMVSSGTLTGSWEVERGICDCQDAAEQIIYLFNNPNKCKEFGENGRKAVLEKYDFENIIGPIWEAHLLK